VAVGASAMTNGEFSGSSSSSTRPMSYGSTRSADAGTYAGGGSGSVSSGSVPYNSAQTNDAWNDRPTSVHTGYTAEAGDAFQYSSVVPPSQRQPQSAHSNNVQEYDISSLDFNSF